MSIERLKEKLDQIQARIPVVRGRGEEATKQALVLPMLEALGYDIWNPTEVCPEYDADFATKKFGQKERVDLAVVLEGTPRIFFEVKAIDAILDGHEGQLARYFNATPSVSLGILTNGAEYRFFTDTGEPNIMDAQPFYVFKLDAPDFATDVIARFHKAVFSPTAIRDYATELNYTWKIVNFLRTELDLRNREPSDALVRWILTSEKMYEGRIMANVVDRFRPITKNALTIVLRDVVRRSVAALDEGVTAPAPVAAAAAAPAPTPVPDAPAASTADAAADAVDVRSKAETTERELEAFAVVRGIFERSEYKTTPIFDATARKDVPIELGYKDTTGYFGIYFNKPAWWVLRLVVEGRSPWVGFNLPTEKAASLLPAGKTLLGSHPYAPTRVAITGPEDLAGLDRIIVAAMQTTVDERRLK